MRSALGGNGNGTGATLHSLQALALDQSPETQEGSPKKCYLEPWKFPPHNQHLSSSFSNVQWEALLKNRK